MKNNDKIKVLVVDDEIDILELLEYNLVKEGYQVKTAKNGKEAIDIAKVFVPNIILIDIMMPVMDGIEACKRLKEIESLSKTFILFLTARTEEYSEIAAFESGADDYIAKPIKPKALLSRINALVRRDKKTEESNAVLPAGDIVINRNTYIVYRGEEEISLPRKEFELLYFLASNPNKVFNRDELLQKVWGTDVYVLSRTVDVHIRKVRERLGENYITTIKGVGYKFEYEEI